MHASFETAHAFTARWEGGLTDHPADPGGITHYGVSLRWLQHLEATVSGCATLRRVGVALPVSAISVRALTRAQAAQLFQGGFWEPQRCAELPLPLAVTLYDAAVNTGGAQATRLLQRSCNVVGEAHLDSFTPLAEDGRCGPLTIRRCHELAEAGLDYYSARHCVRARQQFYTDLARRREDLRVFLKGWQNRCASLLEYLAELERGV